MAYRNPDEYYIPTNETLKYLTVSTDDHNFLQIYRGPKGGTLREVLHNMIGQSIV